MSPANEKNNNLTTEHTPYGFLNKKNKNKNLTCVFICVFGICILVYLRHPQTVGQWWS